VFEHQISLQHWSTILEMFYCCFYKGMDTTDRSKEGINITTSLNALPYSNQLVNGQWMAHTPFDRHNIELFYS
jgi:hypothetical protein